MRVIRWLVLLGMVIFIAGLLTLPGTLLLRVWWSTAVPAMILAVMVLGHDAWRRTCPISAINQLPRLLGIGRTARVPSDSWLARHALVLQFTLLTACVILRLVLLNHSSLALGIFLAGLLLTALAVGFLSGGKTWCNLVCPLAPVQMVYSGPRGLLATPAAQGGSGPGLSQSMCRNLRDEPICVACQTTCPDIDLEKSYWEHLNTVERRSVVYGYLGLVLGYVIHVRTAADVVWAAPVVLAAIAGSMAMGAIFERLLAAGPVARHRLMTVTTVTAFTVLVGGGLLPSLPELLRVPVAGATAAAVAMWSWNVWPRSQQVWQRETLAAVLRRRLAALSLDLAPHLDGRTLDQLSADEVGVLATVLPGLDQKRRQELYQGVLTDAAAAGQLGSRDGDALLTRLRGQLGIADEQHALLLMALPTAGATPRLDSYRIAVERQVLDGLAEGEDLAAVIERRQESLTQLRAAYSVSDDEQEQVIQALTDGSGLIDRAGEALVAELVHLCAERAALGTDGTEGFLRAHLEERAQLLARQLSGVRAALGPSAAGERLAKAVATAAIDPGLVPGAGGLITPAPLAEVRAALKQDADPIVAAVAGQPAIPAVVLRLTLAGREVPCAATTATVGRDVTSTVVVNHPQASRNHAQIGLEDQGAWLQDLGSANGTLVDGRLVRGTRVRLRAGAEIRIGTDGPLLGVAARESLPDGRVGLFMALRSSALGGLPREVLWDLAGVSIVRTVPTGGHLLHAGTRVDELLVLVSGLATAQVGGRPAGDLAAGETIGELALISDCPASTAVVALSECTLLAIPGVRVASLFARHPGVAVALLALTGRRLATLQSLAPDDAEKITPC